MLIHFQQEKLKTLPTPSESPAPFPSAEVEENDCFCDKATPIKFYGPRRPTDPVLVILRFIFISVCKPYNFIQNAF